MVGGAAEVLLLPIKQELEYLKLLLLNGSSWENIRKPYTHTHTHIFAAALSEKTANVFMNPVHVLVPGGGPGETCR